MDASGKVKCEKCGHVQSWRMAVGLTEPFAFDQNATGIMSSRELATWSRPAAEHFAADYSNPGQILPHDAAWVSFFSGKDKPIVIQLPEGEGAFEVVSDDQLWKGVMRIDLRPEGRYLVRCHLMKVAETADVG